MKHEPFVTWLVTEDPLPPEDAKQLKVHLKHCEDCRQLQAAWLNVEGVLGNGSLVSPSPGFVTRWQKRLEIELLEEKYTRHRWQSWIFFILTFNVIVFLILALGFGFMTTYNSPAEFILAYITRLSSLVSFINTIQNITLIMINTLVGLVPQSWWILFMTGTGLISLFWIYAIQRISIQPRRA